MSAEFEAWFRNELLPVFRVDDPVDKSAIRAAWLAGRASQLAAVKDAEIAQLREALDQAIENAAKAIYAQWYYEAEYVPWVERGNSVKQHEARDIAREALLAALEAQDKGVGE